MCHSVIFTRQVVGRICLARVFFGGHEFHSLVVDAVGAAEPVEDLECAPPA
jgi:hypothetical protein